MNENDVILRRGKKEIGKRGNNRNEVNKTKVSCTGKTITIEVEGQQ